MDVTLFELHFPGAQFNAPFSGRTARLSEANAGEDGPDTNVDAGGTSGPGARVALGILVALALLAWYLRRGPADVGGEDE